MSPRANFMASLPVCEAGRAVSTAACSCLCQDLASWYLSVSHRPLCVPVETIRHLNCAYFPLVLTAVNVNCFFAWVIDSFYGASASAIFRFKPFSLCAGDDPCPFPRRYLSTTRRGEILYNSHGSLSLRRFSAKTSSMFQNLKMYSTVACTSFSVAHSLLWLIISSCSFPSCRCDVSLSFLLQRCIPIHFRH